ncbi:MAG: DUF4147 domain-containing protein, partial [Deltaproteobacteria bacterium]|nr:DUF4147 domain-containing protein [Deltaproteobacteria bacterium]
MASRDLRADARAILSAGLAAVEPGAAIRRHLRREGSRLLLPRESALDLPDGPCVVAVAVGKAATAMALALEEILGDRLDRGLIVRPHGQEGRLRSLPILEAAHPLPDEAGLQASAALGALLDGCDRGTLLVAAISGGASSLLPAPPPGLHLEELRRTGDLLLRSGAGIREINAVRGHLSCLGAGGAAARAGGATILSLVLSDVPGDDPSVVGGGPFAPDPSLFRDAWQVLDDRGLLEALPGAVREHLAAGLRGERPETPKPGAACFRRARTLVVGSCGLALRACRGAAEALGYAVLEPAVGPSMSAEALGRHHAELARRLASGRGPVPVPACILTGGEPPVQVRGSGRGGRCQHLALAAAEGLAGLDGALLLAAATDGRDGSTDAAGAFADGGSMARAAALGLDVRAALGACDSHRIFSALGDLLVTGPSG